jgi:hypothetical protein
MLHQVSRRKPGITTVMQTIVGIIGGIVEMMVEEGGIITMIEIMLGMTERAVMAMMVGQWEATLDILRTSKMELDTPLASHGMRMMMKNPLPLPAVNLITIGTGEIAPVEDSKGIKIIGGMDLALPETEQRMMMQDGRLPIIEMSLILQVAKRRRLFLVLFSAMMVRVKAPLSPDAVNGRIGAGKIGIRTIRPRPRMPHSLKSYRMRMNQVIPLKLQSPTGFRKLR